MSLLTVPEVAERLNVSTSWVYREIRKGGLKRTHFGRALRVREAVLAKYVDASRSRSASGGRRPPASRATRRRRQALTAIPSTTAAGS